jgi:hypothetical protein
MSRVPLRRGEKFTYVGFQPWMVMMERARAVIPEFGRDINQPLHPTYEEQLQARADHRRLVAAITGITPEVQHRHYLQAAQDHEERIRQ